LLGAKVKTNDRGGFKNTFFFNALRLTLLGIKRPFPGAGERPDYK
jgi:hypothetical protein